MTLPIIKELTLAGISTIILSSKNVAANYDICVIIYNFYKYRKPHFIKGEKCIKMFEGGEQLVTINTVIYNIKLNRYNYLYTYYPISEGWGNHWDLRKLTKKEQDISPYKLPMNLSFKYSII